MPSTAKGFPSPAVFPDDNANHVDIQALADRLDAILSARTAAQITAFAGTDLWVGRTVRQSNGTGSTTRQQSGLYTYDGAWKPDIGDGLGGTATGPVLTAASANPNMGTSPTLTWDWWMMGDWVTGQLIIQWGTGSPTPGTGELIVSVPIAPVAIASPSGGLRVPLGTGYIRDASAGTTANVMLMTTGGSASTGRLAYDGAVSDARVTGAAPLTLGAAGDQIKITLRYPTV